MSREEYHTPFYDARLRYNDLMMAEHRFRQELAKLQLTCPACKQLATLNYDGTRDYYWISCTKCGLRTSSSSSFSVVTYQWDALWERPLAECYEPYLGVPNTVKQEDTSDLEL